MDLNQVPIVAGPAEWKADGSWEKAFSKLKTVDPLLQHNLLKALSRHSTDVVNYSVDVIRKVLFRLQHQRAKRLLVRYAFEARCARKIVQFLRSCKRRREVIIESSVRYWTEQAQAESQQAFKVKSREEIKANNQEPLYRMFMFRKSVPRSLKVYLVRELYAQKKSDFHKARKAGALLLPPHRMRPETLLLVDPRTRNYWQSKAADYIAQQQQQQQLASGPGQPGLRSKSIYFLSPKAILDESAGDSARSRATSGEGADQLQLPLEDSLPREDPASSPGGDGAAGSPTTSTGDDLGGWAGPVDLETAGQDLFPMPHRSKPVFAPVDRGLRHRSIVQAGQIGKAAGWG
eukprot:RCo019166